MRLVRIGFLALGAALLWAVVAHSDTEQVWAQIRQFGLLSALVVIGIYLVEFSAETGGWLATLVEAPPRAKWFRRLFLVRLVGEAVNDVTPLGSVGGEPLKAVLLRRYYGVGYQASAASLVLATTVGCIALVVFLAGGFALVALDGRFSPAYKTVAGAGLAVLVVAIALFVAAQRYRVSSRLAARLGATRAGARVLSVLHHVQAFDERLARFHTTHRRRFAVALATGLASWYLGAFAIWCSAYLLGSPVTVAEAYMIETLTQLVRTGAFFVPVGLGVQEGAFVLAFEVLTGQGATGLAVGLVKRGRELVWIVAGLATGWLYSLKVPREARSGA